MASRQADVLKIIGRARKVANAFPGEWSVEQVDNGSYKIVCPDGYPVPVHLTPSDFRWERNLMGELNRRGFVEAEAAVAEQEKNNKAAKLAAGQATNERRLSLAATRSKLLTKAAGPYGPSTVAIEEILAEHSTPTTYTRVLVTPDMAKAMLVRNAPTDKTPWENRSMSFLDVAVWEGVLHTGRWLYTHQGVAFDTTGRLQDGQTRLTAIANSGVAAELMVSVGMDPRNFPVIDGNRKRTAGQVLRMLGFKDSNPVSSAIRLVYLFEVWGRATLDHSRQRVTNDLIADVADRLDQEDLEWALKWAYRLRREIGGAISAPIAAMYLIRHKMPPDDPRVIQFADQLVEGVVGEDRAASPIYQLRRQMARQPTANRRLAPAELFALIVKGWNAFVEGDYDGEHLVVQRGSKMPTIFLPPPVDVEQPAETELVDA